MLICYREGPIAYGQSLLVLEVVVSRDRPRHPQRCLSRRMPQDAAEAGSLAVIDLPEAQYAYTRLQSLHPGLQK